MVINSSMKVTNAFPKLHPLHKSSFSGVSSEKRLNNHDSHDPESDKALRKDYVEIFFTILYFLCILPFKLERKQSSLYLRKNIFQQFGCILFHATAVLYQIVDVLSATKEAIYKDPEKIFQICFSIIDLFYILWAIKTVWVDQPKFLKLIECMSATRSLITKNQRRLQIKRFLICSVPLFATIIDIIHILFMEDGPIWKKVPSEPLLSAPLFTLLYDKPAPLLELGVVIYFSSVLTNLVLYNCLDGFLLTLSVSGYEVANYYAKIAKKTKNRISNSLDTLLLRPSYLIDESAQLKLYFETINDASSGFFLFWFCSFCPWTALNLIKSLPGFNTWGTIVYNFFYMTYYGIMMTFCVKAKKKVT